MTSVVGVCKIDLLKFKSMLLRDKSSHLRPPTQPHPMPSKNIFDAVPAYLAKRPGSIDIDLNGLKM
jgi:hypothetical protein